jgi:hypothetical protein
MDWFRMYSEFASDPKVQSMSEAMQRRLMMLLCLRCSNTLVTLQDDEIAFALRISDEELAATKVLFLRKSFIDDAWEIMNWDKRQFVSDSSAQRVSKHRAAKKEAQKQGENIPVTPCNVTVTPQNRTDTEQIQNRTDKTTPPANDTAIPTSPAKNEKAGAVVILPHVALSIAFRKSGVDSKPDNPMLTELAKQGVTPETVLAACEAAKAAKPGESIGMTYVIRIIERWAREAAAMNVVGARPPAARASPSGQKQSRHSGFEHIDYSEGIEDGRIT